MPTSAYEDHEARIAVLETQIVRILGNGQPGEIEATRQWVNLELKELHRRISAVRDETSIKTWGPLVLMMLSAAASWATVFIKH